MSSPGQAPFCGRLVGSRLRTTVSQTRRLLLTAVLTAASIPLAAQELEPGAYLPAPVGVNIVLVSNTVNFGDLAFEPSIPIEDGKATINATSLGFFRTANVLGRLANYGVVMPYTIGNLEGVYLGETVMARRSGLRDPVVRLALNLHGAPAMTLKEFAGYRQKTIVGVSLTMAIPLGQYDPAKLVNIGANRWSFKPQIGLSRAAGRWTFDVYGGAWLFTDNADFSGGRVRSQAPIGSVQFHVLRTFRPNLWAAFDANFYSGGRTTVDGEVGLDLQRNSRVGVTVSIPVARRQSIKVSYSRGAYTTIGADFNSIGVAYQYLWGAGL